MTHPSNAAGLTLWQRLVAPSAFVTAVLIVTALYAAFQLTPSSYARALYMIGVTDTGLLFGFAQEERSDEWALWTPYVQIAVNNGFARIEHISPYEADLRNFNALPLWDWGLIFKPQMWAFFVLPPAAGVLADVRDPARGLLDRLVPAGTRTALFGCRSGDLLAQHVRAALCAALVDDDRSAGRVLSVAAARLHRADAAVAAHSAAGVDHRHVPAVAFLHDLHRLARIRGRRSSCSRCARTCSRSGASPSASRAARSASASWCSICGGRSRSWPTRSTRGIATSLPGGIVPYSWLLAHLFPHFVSSRWEAFYWNNVEIGTGGSYALLFTLVFVNFHRLREVICGAHGRGSRDTLGARGARGRRSDDPGLVVPADPVIRREAAVLEHERAAAARLRDGAAVASHGVRSAAAGRRGRRV